MTLFYPARYQSQGHNSLYLTVAKLTRFTVVLLYLIISHDHVMSDCFGMHFSVTSYMISCIIYTLWLTFPFTVYHFIPLQGRVFSQPHTTCHMLPTPTISFLWQNLPEACPLIQMAHAWAQRTCRKESIYTVYRVGKKNYRIEKGTPFLDMTSPKCWMKY